MSTHSSAGSSQFRRPSADARRRIVVYSCLPPQSATLREIQCEALDDGGRRYCRNTTNSGDEPWCGRHEQQLNQLKARLREAMKTAEMIKVIDADSAKSKVHNLSIAVDLRQRIHKLIFPFSNDAEQLRRWIGSIEQEIRLLADGLLIKDLNREPGMPQTSTSTLSDFEEATTLQPLMDSRIQFSALETITHDADQILILKEFYNELRGASLKRLYGICRDLDDSPERAGAPFQKPPEDRATPIVRTWFRIMIFNSKDVDTLERATRCRSIDEFLSGSQASQLELYCDFFEKAWHPQSLLYLRAAICASLLDTQTMRTVTLLGGTIPTGDQILKMTKAAWDFMYEWFPTLLTPWTLSHMCLYGSDKSILADSFGRGEYRELWYDAKEYLGFARDAILRKARTGSRRM